MSDSVMTAKQRLSGKNRRRKNRTVKRYLHRTDVRFFCMVAIRHS